MQKAGHAIKNYSLKNRIGEETGILKEGLPGNQEKELRKAGSYGFCNGEYLSLVGRFKPRWSCSW